jgi:hypothetical protein
MNEENYPQSPSPMQGYRAAAIIAVLALCVGLFGYAVHERGQAAKVTAQNQQVTSSLADTKGQIETLTAKLNELSAAEQARQQEQERAREQARAHAAAAAHRNSRVAGSRRRADDARWKKVQSELDANKQAIDATRNDLTQAKTELGGSIARTHDELVVLQRKGERNYYEFDIDKSKHDFRKAGSVGIQLRKANTKKQYADLHLSVDDTQLEKKHVNLLEPVIFLTDDSGQPVQLVIQRITKDHIHGYVAEPKYKASELAATSSSNTDVSQSNPPQRKKLAIPQ